MKQKYYFTFGSSPLYPYQNGYLTITANNEEQARLAFGYRYPNRADGNVLNFAFIYDSEKWENDCKKYYTNQPPIKEFNAEDILVPALLSFVKERAVSMRSGTVELNPDNGKKIPTTLYTVDMSKLPLKFREFLCSENETDFHFPLNGGLPVITNKAPDKILHTENEITIRPEDDRWCAFVSAILVDNRNTIEPELDEERGL